MGRYHNIMGDRKQCKRPIVQSERLENTSGPYIYHGDSGHTYFVTSSSSLSGSWRAIIYHNRLAPAQSIRELEFVQEYPRTGGCQERIEKSRKFFLES